MKVLLDTHAFIWAVLSPGKLSARVRDLLAESRCGVVVSAATTWEIATKFRLGKLPGAAQLVADYAYAQRRFQAEELALSNVHALKAGLWDAPHRDPFDRMLAAQSAVERLPLISCDPAMAPFGIEIIW